MLTKSIGVYHSLRTVTTSTFAPSSGTAEKRCVSVRGPRQKSKKAHKQGHPFLCVNMHWWDDKPSRHISASLLRHRTQNVFKLGYPLDSTDVVTYPISRLQFRQLSLSTFDDHGFNHRETLRQRHAPKPSRRLRGHQSGEHVT